MALNPDARYLIELAEKIALPPIETLDAETARAHYDVRSAKAVKPEVAEVVDRRIPGPGGEIPVRIYRPIGEESERTGAIVFFHGGGWVIGTLDTHDSVSRALANTTNCVVVSVDYRLAPEHPFPAAIDDSHAATEWVLDNADHLRIDAGAVSVCGDSAGGNLATAVAQMLRDQGRNLTSQLLVYPATDLTDHTNASMVDFADDHLLTAAAMKWFTEHYTPDPGVRSDFRCSPALGDLHGLPPTLVLLAECDPLRSEGEEFAEALADAGVPTELVILTGQVHTFFTQIGLIDEAQRAVDEIARFHRSLG